ncbi:MAG: hypothetical protein [Caudoviricetes sp.]|nr:MAG: hypothetical protein [Caudoviricetes sp.]
MEQLIKLIEQWAEDRNIINGSKPIDQAMKLFSEFGELADNVGKGSDCRDDIGDVFVVLTIMSAQLNIDIEDALNFNGIAVGSLKHAVVGLGGCLSYFVEEMDTVSLICSLEMLDAVCNESKNILEECVQLAYNDIKDRTGVMYNGVFIKSTDDKYPEIMRELGK